MNNQDELKSIFKSFFQSSAFSRQSYETDLHLAVLDDDYATIEKLKGKPKALETKNSLGFTALELAQLLGKKKCLILLAPVSPHKIKIILKNEDHLKTYNEDEFQAVMGLDYISGIRFSSYDLLKEVIRDIPWTLKASIFGRKERQHGEIYREKIWQGYVVDSIVKWIDPGMGYGLFADQNIRKGDYIGEYVGVVRWLSSLKPNLNEYCFLYPTRFFTLNYYVIDSLKAGNEIRFVNHSDNPNLQPVWAVDRNLLHMTFLANQDIPKGTQLTFDYGEDYWRNRSKI